MRQPIAKMVRVAGGENLGLGFEAAKGARMDDTVAVPRISAAVRMVRLGKTPSAGFFCAHGPRGRRGKSCDGRSISIRKIARESLRGEHQVLGAIASRPRSA